eukprot:GHVR01043728.1.p1 GENE.GHVR01043728.1~~GHVR01043728.1.p1  ORF type:complete len:683 (+),score=125.12 GHVR01043728.1:59-2107(+)
MENEFAEIRVEGGGLEEVTLDDKPIYLQQNKHPSNLGQDIHPSRRRYSVKSIEELVVADPFQVDKMHSKNLTDHWTKLLNEERDIKRDIDLRLTFKDVSFKVKDRKTKEEKVILSPISGHFESGQMVAIMGPSGSGKTTLLDILSGRKTTSYEGEVWLNGRPRDKYFRRITGYVSQFDVAPAHWTVREAVTFNQVLKVPVHTPTQKANRAQKLQECLDVLGLTTVEHTVLGSVRVRGISGGQRRRVGLARALVAGNQLLFCDEPTSGLSSTDAELCVKAMRLIAEEMGVLFIVVIHQPRIEIARLFDTLLLLTSNPGRCTYFGPMENAVAHWAHIGFPVPPHVNPTDHFLDLVTPDSATDQSDLLLRHFEGSVREPLTLLVDRQSTHVGLDSIGLLELRHKQQTADDDDSVVKLKLSKFDVSFFVQAKELLKRKVAILRRDVAVLRAIIFVEIIKGNILGIAFFQIGKQTAIDAQLPFFFMLLQSGAMSGMMNMPRFIDERVVMQYEVSECLYSEWAHIAINTVMNTALSIFGNLIFILIMWAYSGVDWSYFGVVYGWSLLMFLTFDSLFSAVAAFARDGTTAQQFALPFLIMFMIYNGFFVRVTTVASWMVWALYISPFFWTFEQIVVTLFSGEPQGDRLIESFGFKEGRSLLAVIVMCSEMLILRILQVLALKFTNKIGR